ncbi:hypothetical protein [Novosphingobium sp.]|uniref:hypothetical protein n=1 Tax=Novosphingobium sp. TaxID=1874826 RepID=UPI00352A5600
MLHGSGFNTKARTTGPSAIKSTIYTGTNAHVNDIGVQYYGSTAANSVLAALIAKYA